MKGIKQFYAVLKYANLQALGVSGSEMVGWVCGSLFSGQGTELATVSPRPAHLPFLWAVLDLAVVLDDRVSELSFPPLPQAEGGRPSKQSGQNLYV